MTAIEIGDAFQRPKISLKIVLIKISALVWVWIVSLYMLPIYNTLNYRIYESSRRCKVTFAI